MRLHVLEVTAFGPFAGTERVDVDALGDAGIFLVHGRTGAGKSSVLDAVCYALYGVVPGARQRAARLRSDHAPTDRRAIVRVELTVRGRRVRVTREPAWERPKRRGAGTTSDPARTVVEERSGATWTTLSTRNDEAGHLLRGLLGMSADQFCQVVLLPQGQFADFLRADAEARRPLLEQLFDTRRFSAVEQWLAERRRETWRAVQEGRSIVDEIVARAVEASGVDEHGAGGVDEHGAGGVDEHGAGGVDEHGAGGVDERGAEHGAEGVAEGVREHVGDGVAAPGSGDGGSPEGGSTRPDVPANSGDWLAALLDRARGDEAAALAARLDAEGRAAEATARCRDTAALADRQRRHAEAAARAASVAAAAGRRQALGTELAAARRAVGVVPVLGAQRDAGRAVRVAVGEAEAATGALVSVAPGLALVGEEELRAAARSARSEAARLDELVAAEGELATLGDELDTLTRETAALRTRVAAAEVWLGSAPARRTGLESRVRAAQAAAASRDGVAAEVAGLSARVAAARRRDRLTRAVAATAARLAEAVDAAQAARQDWLDLRQARLEGIAAELAAQLVVGCGCPVCGSAEHPRPAAVEAGGVTVAEEKAAERLHLERETDRAALESELAALRADLAGATAQSGGDEPVTALTDALGGARRWLAQRDAEAAGAAAHAGELAAHDAQAQRRCRVRDDGRAREEELVARHADVARRRGGLAARVAGARGDDPSLHARRSRLLAVAAATDAAADARRELDSACRRRARDSARLRAACAEAGFPDPAAAAAAARDEAARQVLEAELDTVVAEAHAVAALLADPDLRAAAACPAADVSAAQATARAAGAELSAAAGAAATASARVSALDRLRGALADAVTRLRPLEERHDCVEGLSRLSEGTGGNNAKRMRLSAYVLAARLEQVAAAASERLVRMSGGRYTLVHTDEGGGRSRAGLGLRVVDAWTGIARDTTTLSGGEAFAASLALALGLADVVTAEAGGALIETLFVDEGFGSLDDDTLDEVMDVLDGLRAGGRVVGIVSHVVDLRQRIPAQLHVRKDRDGSTLRAVTA